MKYDNKIIELEYTYKTLFDCILMEIWERVDKIDPLRSIGEAFYEVMRHHLVDLFDTKFIKYINLFNNAEEYTWGSVDFYADLFHSEGGTKRIRKGKKLVTRNRSQVDIGKNIAYFEHAKAAIEFLFYNKVQGDSLNNIFECVHRYNQQVGIGQYSAMVEYDNYIKRKNVGYDDKLYMMVYRENAQVEMQSFVIDLDECYGIPEGEITNSFVVYGYSFPEGQDEVIKKYTVCAIVGIDNQEGGLILPIRFFLQRLQDFVERLSKYIIDEVKRHQSRRTAVVGAIGKAIVRNMSHNIGSHVLNNLTDCDVYEKLADRVILQSNAYQSSISDNAVGIKGVSNENFDKNIVAFKDNLSKRIGATVSIVKDADGKGEMTIPFKSCDELFRIAEILGGVNLQLPYFIQYMKNRMDYLSEVAFGIPNVLTTKYMYNDVFKEFDREKILLNRISGISDFKYSINLKYNGNLLDDGNDIAVAFSSDVLGTQAFYNIIENIIRNTAKHAYSGGQRVNFTIEFANAEGYPSYYCVEIDNGILVHDIDELVRKQNELIEESVLDERNDLRNHGLGLLEMAINAAFLRQVETAKVDYNEYRVEDNNGSDKLVLLKAINKNGTLAYRFYMQKPKEFLFVGDWSRIDETRKSESVNLGIQFVDENAFVNSLNRGKSYSQKFLFYENNASEEIKKKLIEADTLLPLRRLMVSDNEMETLLKIINKNEIKDIVDDLKEFSWTKYFNDILFAELKNPENHNVVIRTSTDFDLQENGFSRNQVVFLHHGDKDTHNTSWSAACEREDCEAFVEILSSKTSTILPEFNSYSNGGDVSYYCDKVRKMYRDKDRKVKANRISFPIFEAYHNKVIVLDERIQKFSKEKFEGSDKKDRGGAVPCSEVFESTNVHIPEMPLDPEIFTEESKRELEDFVDKELKGAFLLVHYGVLERLYKNDKAEITSKLNKWAEVAKRVVVTSGRGAHSLPLPPSVCFADLSSVLYAFKEDRNKFTINDLLNQSRRKHE